MYQRHIQPHLLRLAKQYPVVTITGPRQSGKTTLCQQSFPNYTYVNLEDPNQREIAIQDPKGFLSQYNGKGVIIDEIQRAPDLPSYVQLVVDQQPQAGQFILTGSQQFEVMDTISQTLAGRTALLRLLPLAYTELYDLPGQKMPTITEVIYQGFYPRIFKDQLNPTEALSFYLHTYVERDVRSLLNIKKLSAFERFLKSCANQIGQLLNYSALANDSGVDQKTIKSWLSVLEARYIIYFLKPYHKSFRKRLTKSPKLYFYDVGLASYLLNINEAQQISSHPLKGLLFENFIVTEFVKQYWNQVREHPLSFFRDHAGHEVDLILEQAHQLCSIEIKYGQTFQSSQLKGLRFYQQLAGELNHKQSLIYGGEEHLKLHDTAIFPFHQLAKVFEYVQNH